MENNKSSYKNRIECSNILRERRVLGTNKGTKSQDEGKGREQKWAP